jgi:Ran GTPase-activating protein (RanGAP) involved in mRNA processing and transport
MNSVCFSDEEAWLEVLKSLASCGCLKTLRFSIDGFSMLRGVFEHGQRLVASLSACAPLEVLTLKNCRLSQDACEDVAKLIQKNVLTRLDLSHHTWR